jgi:prepilin-type N-terminal cleavage/methylation domain-containing protein
MKQKARNSGFTLAEIAVVLAIIGIAMTMGLKMLTATFENSAYSETKAKQERIKLALVSFMRSNGRLPCPDTTALLGNPTGLEAAVCTTAAPLTNPAAGSGLLPWVTLGLARDAVLDGWGNFFTYRVANFVPVVDAATAVGAVAGPPLHPFTNHNWTTAAGFDIRSLNTEPATGSQTFLIQTRLTPAVALTSESRNAVAVILSHGKNGLGARTTRPVAVAALPAAAVGPDERTTGTPGTKIFVRRAFNDVAIDPVNNLGGPIDDVVAYLTPQDLLQPLINEKTLLGACSAYCGASAAVGCTPLTPAAGMALISVGASAPLPAAPTSNCP